MELDESCAPLTFPNPLPASSLRTVSDKQEVLKASLWPENLNGTNFLLVSLDAAGDVLRGDDHAAGRLRYVDGLPAEQLPGAAAALHRPSLLLLYWHRGGPRTRYG